MTIDVRLATATAVIRQAGELAAGYFSRRTDLTRETKGPQDFVSIAVALGEKPGNLLSNDLGEIGHLKPLIDRLASVRPEFLPRVSTIIEKIVLLTEHLPNDGDKPRRKSPAVPRRKRHR